MIRKFGEYENQEVHLYEIENDNYAIGMMDYGATLVYWVDKRIKKNIVLGFDNFESYIDNSNYFGATIGRVCNRIGEGKYELDGTIYHLDKNDKGNTLHGGASGFGHRMYRGRIEDNAIIFDIYSENGEGGFNGNISFEAKYILEENGLRFIGIAESDEDTIFAPTSHSYFNLNGSGSALEHMLQIDSEEFVPIDQNGLAKDEIQPVEYTPFDFREEKKIGEDIRNPYEQLIKGCGYDHHYIIEGDGYRHFVTLSNGKSELKVYSTMPGVQFYSGNFLNDPFEPNEGVCFETQYVPNAINAKLFEKPILFKNVAQKYETFFELNVIDNNE